MLHYLLFFFCTVTITKAIKDHIITKKKKKKNPRQQYSMSSFAIRDKILEIVLNKGRCQLSKTNKVLQVISVLHAPNHFLYHDAREVDF